MPLSFLAAFVWKWPVPYVVIAIQSDQIFKGLPTPGTPFHCMFAADQLCKITRVKNSVAFATSSSRTRSLFPWIDPRSSFVMYIAENL